MLDNSFNLSFSKFRSIPCKDKFSEFLFLLIHSSLSKTGLIDSLINSYEISDCASTNETKSFSTKGSSKSVAKNSAVKVLLEAGTKLSE